MVEKLRQRAAALLLYQDVWRHPVGQTWLQVVDLLSTAAQPTQILEAYGRFFSQLAQLQLSWPEFLIQRILVSENPFSRAAAAYPVAQLPKPLIAAAWHDLLCLQNLALADELLHQELQKLNLKVWWPAPEQLSLPWDPQADPCQDWGDSLESLAQYYRTHGVGICAEFSAFRWHHGQLQGVSLPDAVEMDWIYGNQRQKQRLCANTEALIAGQPALHVLLYGARGTGKSSLVKSLLHRYSDRGLRIVELSRDDLIQLPEILADLHHRPHSFILFVDDLSFEADETDFKHLKVLLEGDIAAQPKNARLYATTNRRHLIREFFPDRPSPSDDEVHAWDTVQEKLSLRDRFGLTLTFTPFTQADYLATVEHLARQFDLRVSAAELRRLALIWAQQQNGFSGRTARQFIDSFRSGLFTTG